MPLYDEKLICPLAIHFTQDHIRPIFQDGHDIESTVKEITTKPGEGDYDVIIEAPFPNIEILRWRQKDIENNGPRTSHWFTLDNRRLYCLQRAAVSLWPRRVAVVVEVLYAAPDDIWRKNTSLTMGHSVGIGHSPKALIAQWCWSEAVLKNETNASTTVVGQQNTKCAAYELVTVDEEKANIEDLLAAPAPPSMLDLYLQGIASPLEASIQNKLVSVGSKASTRSPSTPRSLSGSDNSSPHNHIRDVWEANPTGVTHAEHTTIATLNEKLAGKWQGGQGETYDIWMVERGTWICEHTDSHWHHQKWTLWYDEHNHAVWWGSAWSDYLNVSDVYAESDCIRWFSATETARRRPRYTWYKVREIETCKKPHGKGVHMRMSRRVNGCQNKSSNKVQ